MEPLVDQSAGSFGDLLGKFGHLCLELVSEQFHRFQGVLCLGNGDGVLRRGRFDGDHIFRQQLQLIVDTCGAVAVLRLKIVYRVGFVSLGTLLLFI